MKKQIRLTESELHNLIENTIKNILNEGAGWDVFKDSVKNGYNYKNNENDTESNNDLTLKKIINGRPNKLKSDFHKSMAGSIDNPEEKLNHSYKAIGYEPGFGGEAKRFASVAGAVGGALSRDIVDGVKRGVKNIKSKFNKKEDNEDYPIYSINNNNKKSNVDWDNYHRTIVPTNNPNYDKRGYELWKKEHGKDYDESILNGVKESKNYSLNKLIESTVRNILNEEFNNDFLETSYGLKFNILDNSHIDDFIGYDRSVAESHLNNFGCIVVGEYGDPIDDENDLEEIKNIIDKKQY